MSVLSSRPVLRWAVPASALVAVIGGGVLTTALSASADANLPPRTAAQLLVDLQTARLDGAYGTVVERADLGLPALPTAGGGDSADLNSLITGSHTLRVWYSGPDKARVALLGAVGESDVVRNGSDAWVWSSMTNSAVHMKVDGQAGAHHPGLLDPSAGPSDLPTTPQAVADRILSTLGPTTVVSTDGSATVAGRPAYELVFAPKDSSSLVAQVRIAIDGTAHVPTRAEIFAKGYPSRAAFEIAFTQVSFNRPDAGVFSFSPPPGAKVTESSDAAKQPDNATPPPNTVIGTGWTSVLVARMPQQPADGKQQDSKGRDSAGSITGLLNTLPQVHGAWGSGRLLQSHLFSALLTDDGRILVGAVSGDRLQAAAADPAAALK